jgi:hypothetical protein
MVEEEFTPGRPTHHPCHPDRSKWICISLEIFKEGSYLDNEKSFVLKVCMFFNTPPE